MTKEDYIAIAEILNDAYHLDSTEIDNLVTNFATFFKKENERFDKQRFYDACYKPI